MSDWFVVGVTVFLLLGGMALALWAKRNPKAAQEYDLYTWAKILVAAAEQLYSANEQKFRYVFAHLQQKFPELSEQDVRAVLEWAFHHLKLRQIEALGGAGQYSAERLSQIMTDRFDDTAE